MTKHQKSRRPHRGAAVFDWLKFKVSKLLKKRLGIVMLLTIAAIVGQSMSATLWAQEVPDAAPSYQLASLKTVPIPKPSNLAEFVSNESAAIVLGKALFWDMQTGSDNTQSCASCHFHAGADSRSKHQLSPGLLRVNADGSPDPDTAFELGGLNYQLKPSDYPFHKLADINNRKSTVISDRNDVTGSQGLFGFLFSNIFLRRAQEVGVPDLDPVFKVNNTNLLRVTGRNSPSAINAVFNFRNFWDGRAQNDFNGVNPFGKRDVNAKVVKADGSGELQEVQISLDNASLASQAVGPPLSEVEMSYKGKPFSLLGKKMLPLVPLNRQKVHPDDSVLGSYSKSPMPGMRAKYNALVQAAFQPQWWKSDRLITIDSSGKPTFTGQVGTADPSSITQFSQMEYNFPLFFGLAVQMYESTLVSDDAPIDRYLEGNTNALSAQQKLGKELFEGKAKCINCHGGPEFTNASVQNVKNERLERMVMGDGEVAVYDNGFYDIGVRPTREDLGLGGLDPFGNPLSESRLAQQGKFNDPNLDPPISPNERVAVDGAFKTPGLRNVELTAPYFHNGGQLTLRQVVDFYNRGGDFHEQNIANLDPDIENLGLNNAEKDALVAFMRALTDDRVRYQKAPFDHPQLFVTNGHQGTGTAITDDGTGKATVQMREIPAVGRKGGTPLTNFLASAS
ncbi:cytochrome-c peroxidase [Aliterella atlantica]|nr:cytochrome c peroxidase [Aliterella atlantica]